MLTKRNQWRGIGALGTNLVLVVVMALAMVTPATQDEQGGGVSPAMSAVGSSSGTTTKTRNPFEGVRLYIDPDSSAARAAAAIRSSDPTGAAALDKIAAQPVALWVGDWVATTDVQSVVRRRVDAARAAGAMPLFVLYAIAHRDCGSYSSGGLADAAAYRSWIDQVAQGLAGGSRSAVILEPDALAQLDCLTQQLADERLTMLRAAVERLAATSGVSVYLDAGNGGWRPADVMARRLSQAGVSYARGFSVNVSNFGFTGAEARYGTAISDLLPTRKPFVVDTGRNGRGRATGTLAWCNPPDRALGERPLTSYSNKRVDALLWVKPPGESDGSCRTGEPAAGTFWPEYAIGLATRATW